MDAVVKPIHALTFSKAAAASRPHRWRCTTSVSPRNQATPNNSRPAARPHTPRADNGGHSVNRNFVAGQLSPHPIAVTATQEKPIRRDLVSVASKRAIPSGQFRLIDITKAIATISSLRDKTSMYVFGRYVNNIRKYTTHYSSRTGGTSAATSPCRSVFGLRGRERLLSFTHPRDGPEDPIVRQTDLRYQRRSQRGAPATQAA